MDAEPSSTAEAAATADELLGQARVLVQAATYQRTNARRHTVTVAASRIEEALHALREGRLAHRRMTPRRPVQG